MAMLIALHVINLAQALQFDTGGCNIEFVSHGLPSELIGLRMLEHPVDRKGEANAKDDNKYERHKQLAPRHACPRIPDAHRMQPNVKMIGPQHPAAKPQPAVVGPFRLTC
ncbi:hypothetical protein [Polaromonas sp. A23]|uniref:hypothetical protein n=1 Tax=Polaromonas sp. A23 TaxID=1944133 RepID=UPI0011155722|nr:hypothetical protein [Polaromonas sp. A23]